MGGVSATHAPPALRLLCRCIAGRLTRPPLDPPVPAGARNTANRLDHHPTHSLPCRAFVAPTLHGADGACPGLGRPPVGQGPRVTVLARGRTIKAQRQNNRSLTLSHREPIKALRGGTRENQGKKKGGHRRTERKHIGGQAPATAPVGRIESTRSPDRLRIRETAAKPSRSNTCQRTRAQHRRSSC